VVGPEVVTGSTRMKAGTATKLVLNLLTTGAMIRLGKVHGNLMVDVRATNAKLRDRAERIVMAAAGATRPRAKRLLAAASGQAKLAILMHLARLSAAKAQALLEASDGVLSKALEAAGGDL
jgi:N-acetylmuramic acid 6-phosphate etherase